MACNNKYQELSKTSKSNLYYILGARGVKAYECIKLVEKKVPCMGTVFVGLTHDCQKGQNADHKVCSFTSDCRPHMSDDAWEELFNFRMDGLTNKNFPKGYTLKIKFLSEFVMILPKGININNPEFILDERIVFPYCDDAVVNFRNPHCLVYRKVFNQNIYGNLRAILVLNFAQAIGSSSLGNLARGMQDLDTSDYIQPEVIEISYTLKSAMKNNSNAQTVKRVRFADDVKVDCNHKMVSRKKRI
jgi:hypothetical protein